MDSSQDNWTPSKKSGGNGHMKNKQIYRQKYYFTEEAERDSQKGSDAFK
jgi:hypothetical protein